MLILSDHRLWGDVTYNRFCVILRIRVRRPRKGDIVSFSSLPCRRLHTPGVLTLVFVKEYAAMRKQIVGAALLAAILAPLNSGLAQQPQAVTYSELKACLTSPPNSFVEGTDFVLATPTRIDYYSHPVTEAARTCIRALQAKKMAAASETK